MQIVKIQALPREGFPTRPRAGRFFASSEPTAMEILDVDEDPTVEVEKQDAAGKKFTVRAPDPARMSRKVFEERILTDPVLRVVADGETISELSEAALGAARKQAADLAVKLTDSEVARAKLGDELAKAKKRIAELEAAQVGALAGGGGVANEGAPVEESKPVDKGARGKGAGK